MLILSYVIYQYTYTGRINQMKKKKKMSLLVIIMVIVMGLTGCGGKFTCDICGKEKSGKKYETEMFGQKVTICKDCYNDIQSALDALE